MTQKDKIVDRALAKRFPKTMERYGRSYSQGEINRLRAWDGRDADALAVLMCEIESNWPEYDDVIDVEVAIEAGLHIDVVRSIQI